MNPKPFTIELFALQHWSKPRNPNVPTPVFYYYDEDKCLDAMTMHFKDGHSVTVTQLEVPYEDAIDLMLENNQFVEVNELRKLKEGK